MNRDYLWKRFVSYGRVEDYLNYVKASDVYDGCNVAEDAQINEAENRRADTPGTEYR
ncbi:MAG: hypothetical protein GX051_01830 [Clostridiales bacterium]|nr:hypothetical protein [Clostridiales bacterium]